MVSASGSVGTIAGGIMMKTLCIYHGNCADGFGGEAPE